MEVYKRADAKSWYVDLIHPTTKERIRRSLRYNGNKLHAQRLAQAEALKLLGNSADGKPTVTLGDAVDIYIGSLRARRKVSVKELEYTALKLFGRSARQRFAVDPAQWLHDLTPANMERLVQARMVEGNKPQTIAHEVSLVRSAAKHASGLGYKAPDGMLNGTLKNPWRTPEITEKTRYLSMEEFERVYENLDPDRMVTLLRQGGGVSAPFHLAPAIRAARRDCRDLLVALAYTGARWSEIANLRWEQVDLDAGTIRLWGSKTQRERLVPISERLGTVLGRRHSTGCTGLVFPGPYGRPRAASSGGIRRAMDACGLNAPATVLRYGRATVHSLRHTFASWLVQNGAELGEVSATLGHSTLQMTQRYAHLSKGATVAKLGGILNGLGDPRLIGVTASLGGPTVSGANQD